MLGWEIDDKPVHTVSIIQKPVKQNTQNPEFRYSYMSPIID